MYIQQSSFTQVEPVLVRIDNGILIRLGFLVLSFSFEEFKSILESILIQSSTLNIDLTTNRPKN